MACAGWSCDTATPCGPGITCSDGICSLLEQQIGDSCPARGDGLRPTGITCKEGLVCSTGSTCHPGPRYGWSELQHTFDASGCVGDALCLQVAQSQLQAPRQAFGMLGDATGESPAEPGVLYFSICWIKRLELLRGPARAARAVARPLQLLRCGMLALPPAAMPKQWYRQLSVRMKISCWAAPWVWKLAATFSRSPLLTPP